MKCGIFAVITLALAARAGEPGQTPAGQGYAFFGFGQLPGGGGTVQQIAAGADGRIYKGLSAGAELGFLYPTNEFLYGIGLLSVNGFYYFRTSRQARLVPFVTAGYSLAFRGGHENLANWGGGVTWWMAKHAGIRVQFRDYLWPGCCSATHSPQLLLGFSFR
jgi:hypothetical protein